MKKIVGLLLGIGISCGLGAQTVKEFSNLESLLHYAEGNSKALKVNEQEALLAKWTKITALLNTVNFKSNALFSAIDNTNLPVSFLPGEIRGLPPGTFIQATIGQEYVSNFTLAPQIDIINLEYWAKAKSAKINEDLVKSNNLMAKRTLFESIAASYYNIRQLEKQVQALSKSVLANDTMLVIMQNKLGQGIAKQQDVNEVEVNKIMLEDKLEQTQYSLQKQYLSLKILCDVSEIEEIKIVDTEPIKSYNSSLNAYSSLNYRLAGVQKKLAQTEYRASLKSHLPVVSLMSSWAYQNNSNQEFMDKNASWINSNYVGIKISMPFPIDLNKVAQSTSASYKNKISSINLEHSKLQNDLNNKQMTLDYEKAYMQLNNYEKIYRLKQDTYKKNKNLYDQDLYALDKLLISFNDMINSQLNFINAQMNSQYFHSKININNSIQ